MNHGVPPSPRSPAAPVELRLVIWFEEGAGWRARISGPGLEREFDSPFELARFVAWPMPRPTPSGGRGLR